MTPIEFSAWLNGINAGLCGALPHRAIWAMVVQEAAKLAHPKTPILSPFPPFPPAERTGWWDKHLNPSPFAPECLAPPWVTTCGAAAMDTKVNPVHDFGLTR